MVMILYGWVSRRDQTPHSPFSQRVFWTSQGGPNLVVVGENKIKTFPPSPCPFLSDSLRTPENKGIL